ncbi:MAG: amidohydrolase family protein, partial [Planctomycetota bacterium]
AWSHYHAYPDRAERPEVNHSLVALQPVLSRKIPVALRTKNVHELLALRRVVEEFQLDAWYLGSGQEYQWLTLLAEKPPRVVLPVNFPPPPAIDSPDDAAQVTLRSLELWARAPENPARLHRAGLHFALTPHGLKSMDEFAGALQKVIARGLPPRAVLASLTTIPARFLGLEERLGTIQQGKVAALTVFDGEPFAEHTRVTEVWVDGRRFAMEERPAADLRGDWQLTFQNRDGVALAPATFTVSGDRRTPSVKFKVQDRVAEHARIGVDGTEVQLTFSGEVLGQSGYLRFGGTLFAENSMRGAGFLEDGTSLTFQAQRKKLAAKDEKRDMDSYRQRWKGSEVEPLPVPLGARGRIEKGSKEDTPPGSVFIRNATIWTCAEAGIIEKGNLWIRKGKIAAVGPELRAPSGVPVIDASGKHVTPGLIDVHSHTAILAGINEGTQAVTAEVRIGDVLHANDMNLYRQLAGGLTCAHVMHGSANPIGGQCAVIKLRWGEGPEQLKMEGAVPTIKFALGENVKQSNWGDEFKTRYPQTRMGVEQIIRDAFLAAREYQQDLSELKQKRRSQLLRIPRRDLELEALVEILEGERFIHCHSYRQDEILMLMRLAEEFGFRVGTFQHVLEGYKVAPELAQHGATASTFSDWWAYKFEVYDAIPYNGALMHRAGVLTTFNSDSNELARRMNLEAAKAVKYGGVPREEAFQFVTWNAARQLRIDDRVGSLEEGKDADFVIWSGDPLSTYSICLETWIEGERMFSREQDGKLRQRDAQRRHLLEQRLLEESFQKKSSDKKDSEGQGPTRPQVKPGEGGQ